MKISSILKPIIWLVLALLILLSLVLTWAVSETGAKFLLNKANEKVPGLNLVHQQGGLSSELLLSQLSYKTDAIEAEVSELKLNIAWQCLWSMSFCIEELSADTVNIIIAESESTSQPSEPIIDTIMLPILFELERLNIGKTIVSSKVNNGLVSSKLNKMLQVDQLSLSLDFYESLTVRNLDVQSVDLYSIAPSAQSNPANYQATKNVNAAVTKSLIQGPLSAQQVSLQAQLKKQLGTLRDQVPTIQLPYVFVPINTDVRAVNIGKVCLDKDEHCMSNISLEASHFNDDIDANLQIATIVSKALSPNLSAIEAVNLKLNLTLNQEWPLTAVGSFSNASLGQFWLNIDGDIEHVDAHIDRLAAPDPNNQNMAHDKARHRILSLQSSFDLSNTGLPLTVDLSASKLPNELFEFWQPTSQITLQVVGDIRNYKVNFSSQNLQIETFSLTQFIAQLGILDQGFSLKQLSANGQYKQAPFSVSGALLIQADGFIHADGFTANYLDNKAIFTGKSHLFEKQTYPPLILAFSSPDLSQLIEPAKGSVSVDAKIGSPLLAPTLNLYASAKNIKYGALSLASASIKGNIDVAKKFNSRLQVNVLDLAVNQTQIPQIDLNLTGNDVSQRLALRVPQGDITTTQTIDGGFTFAPESPARDKQESNDFDLPQPTGWKGQVLKSDIKYADFALSIDQPSDIEMDFSQKSVNIATTCWRSQTLKSNQSIFELCLKDAQYTPTQASLDVTLGLDVPSTIALLNQPSIQQSLSDYFDLYKSQIRLSANSQINWSEVEGLALKSHINANDIQLQTDDYRLAFERFELSSQLDKNALSNILHINSQQFGDLQYQGQIAANTGATTDSVGIEQDGSIPREHQGKVILSQIDLSKLGAFIPQLSRMAGDIKGEIDIQGTLHSPRLFGEIDIQDAEFLSAQYPIRISQWQQKINLNGQSADLESSFRLGSYDAGGLGKLKAKLDFADGIEVKGTLSGQDLKFAYEKHELSMSPDLRFEATPERVALTGSVTVPSAKIVIESLPESAVSPSRDIIIVDQQTQVVQSALLVSANLNVLIDPQQQKNVRLNALDLKTALTGDLNLKVNNQDISLSGKINLVEGEYKAYGQVLSIRRGEISFTGQPDLPNLDIQAIRNPLNTADNVIAGINVTGNSDAPTVSLFSDPAMDQAKQLSYLLTGQDYNKPGQTSDSNTQLVNALVSFGVGRSENGIGRIGQKLGVENLNIQAMGQGDNTQVQVSGRLSDKIEISYGLGVFDSVSEVKLKYQLIPQVYLEAVSGLNNALDIYYEIERQ